MIRWPWNRLVGKDDIAVAIATVKLQPPLTLYSVQYWPVQQAIAVAQVIVILRAVPKGLGTVGRELSDDAKNTMNKVR